MISCSKTKNNLCFTARYRGYYYDNETGYYYLQSRYYDPDLGRFISADDFSYVDTSHKLNVNAYSYCWNSPIALEDAEGTTPQISIDLSALQPLVEDATTVIKAGLNKFAENIKKLISRYNDFLDKLEFNINHPDVVINNGLSKILGREVSIKFPLINAIRAYFGTFDIRTGELVGGAGDGYHTSDSDNEENGIAPYYIINDDEKTDNWFLAVLKTLAIAIPIHSITIEFEAVIQTYNRSFNFNSWFEELSCKTQSMLTDFFVSLSTIFHTVVKEHWDMLSDLITGKVFDNLLDKNFASSSTGGEIPFFGILFDSIGIFDSFLNGDYTYDQALLSILFDAGLTLLAFAFSEVGSLVAISGIVKLIGDSSRDGIYNYQNGHLWG